jgi:hypothetical protein
MEKKHNPPRNIEKNKPSGKKVAHKQQVAPTSTVKRSPKSSDKHSDEHGSERQSGGSKKRNRLAPKKGREAKAKKVVPMKVDSNAQPRIRQRSPQNSPQSSQKRFDKGRKNGSRSKRKGHTASVPTVVEFVGKLPTALKWGLVVLLLLLARAYISGRAIDAKESSAVQNLRGELATTQEDLLVAQGKSWLSQAQQKIHDWSNAAALDIVAEGNKLRKGMSKDAHHLKFPIVPSP